MNMPYKISFHKKIQTIVTELVLFNFNDSNMLIFLCFQFTESSFIVETIIEKK